jgi:hypothetical protein
MICSSLRSRRDPSLGSLRPSAFIVLGLALPGATFSDYLRAESAVKPIRRRRSAFHFTVLVSFFSHRLKGCRLTARLMGL